MENRDIIQSILYNTNNIDTLAQLCKVDKQSQNICSNRYFGQLYFAKYNLPFFKQSSETL